jgi:hypothetical protein
VESYAQNGGTWKVKIFPSTKVEKIGRHDVVVTRQGKEETWQGFDSIVLAVGLRSRNEMLNEIRDKVGELYVIGDAAGPRKGVDAMREGAEVGRRI